MADYGPIKTPFENCIVESHGKKDTFPGSTTDKYLEYPGATPSPEIQVVITEKMSGE